MPNTQVDQAQRQKIYDEQINILKNLNILQRNEQSLYVQVSEASSQAKKQELMILINELSNQRIKLYNQLLYYTNIIKLRVGQLKNIIPYRYLFSEILFSHNNFPD